MFSRTNRMKYYVYFIIYFTKISTFLFPIYKIYIYKKNFRIHIWRLKRIKSVQAIHWAFGTLTPQKR